MLLSEIRIELVGQHRELRRLAEQARRAAERLGQGDRAAGSEMQWSLSQLAEALGAHNAREAELLGDLIPTIDAWGPVRASLMSAHHREEHDALQAALGEAIDAGTAAAALVAAVAERLLRHMDDEEREILDPRVLRDDICAIDASDG